MGRRIPTHGHPVTRVGFCGLGRMGQPMAMNIAEAGFELALYNRSPRKAEELAIALGARHASTPAACAAGSDIVITMLADEVAVRSALTGPEGILAGLRPGSLIIDMGTTGPMAVRQLADEVTQAGGR